MNTAWRSACFVSFLGVFSTAPARGQWLERTFNLADGWNTIYLEVDPSPADADTLFGGLPIASVWMRAPDSLVNGPPDCPDPNHVSCAPAPESEWRIWLPPNHPGRIATTLRVIRGGRVYLIETTAATSLTVTGIPNASKSKWKQGYNLAGFHVVDDPNSSSTFDAYLSASDAFTGTVIHEVGVDGSQTPIANAATDRVTPGRGYWVKSDRDTVYDGPVAIDSGTLRGVDFGQRLVEHAIEFENLGSSNLNLGVTYTSSASVPPLPLDLPALAGDVPLAWFDYNVGGQLDDSLKWKPFSSNTWSLDPAGQNGARTIARFTVDRVGLSPATVDFDGNGSQYEGLLEVTDGNGYLRRLPVSAQVVGAAGGAIAGLSGGAGPTPGLYYGSVTVNQVAWVSAGSRVWTNSDPINPAFAESLRCDAGDNGGVTCVDDSDCPNGACSPFCIGGTFDGDACLTTDKCTGGTCSADLDTSTLRPTPADFVFPIIIHHASDGAFKLLTEVTVLWEPGDDVAGTPGRYVLATPDCPPAVCDLLEAGSVQDGQPFSRRISTAAFSFDDDLVMTGSFPSTLSGQTMLPADHPLNPFRHKYHPDHDCDLGGECFDITRTFVLAFDSQAPDTQTRPGWGDSFLTGTFTEQVLGLHKKPIHMQGRFEIQRVSQVATLNAQ